MGWCRREAGGLNPGLWAVALVLLAGCEIQLGPPERSGGSGGSGGAFEGGAGGLPSGGVGAQGPSGEVWVYTSIYQSVIEQLDPIILARYPKLKVQWYRAGSEKVATRLEAELQAGGTQADLLMTSDPFWYLKLKEEGHLTPYVTVDVLPIARNLVDPDGTSATCRVSSMVIAYNPDMIAEAEAPRSFKALIEPRYKDKVTLGDPLSSGTHFTTTAFLSTRYGWSYYESLRAQGALASGGNSSVLRRVEGKEFPIGVVLLENVLASQKTGSPVRYILPEDGVITIPGGIAILKMTDNLGGARAIYDLIMSPEGQRAMVVGDMHSANPRIPPPGGTPAFERVDLGQFLWTDAFTEDIKNKAPQIKADFDRVMNK